MPASLVEIVEALLDLLDLVFHWRFWVPILVAAGVALWITYAVRDPALRWMLIVPVVTAGVVTGVVWEWKRG